MSRMTAITPPPPLNLRLWLRRQFLAFVIVFAALCTIADGSLSRAETHRIEEPSGIALIGASLPRKVVAWERTQGTIVENVQGFTLLEIAIVLTVIGLIVGGILWGQEMIGQAGVLGTVSQLQKFNSAVNTFKVKYGYLPGDIPDPYASQFGFAARGQYTGEGDGDGVIEGVYGNVQGWNVGMVECAGETAMLWEDLSAANMIEGKFTTANSINPAGADVSGTGVGNYLPTAKMGNGNYIYAWSAAFSGNVGTTGANYFGIYKVTGISCQSNYGGIVGSPGLTVAQAYSIDKKLDDGLPQTGNIQAIFAQGTNSAWVNTEWTLGNQPSACFSNQFNVYDTANFPNSVNCALSFRMQGAAR